MINDYIERNFHTPPRSVQSKITTEIQNQITELMIQYNYFFDLAIKCIGERGRKGGKANEYYKCKMKCKELDEKLNQTIAFIN